MSPNIYSYPSGFARSELSLEEADYAVLGIPYDSSESYRTGSRFGPSAIRESSKEVEDFDMLEGFDLMELKIADHGDVEVSYGNPKETRERVRASVREILEKKVIPVILGGEHTITNFALSAYEKKPFFISFDAHMDFRFDYLNNPDSHACVTRRVVEDIGVDNCLVVGVRSGSKEEYEQALEMGLVFIDFNNCWDIEALTQRIKGYTRGKDVYVSIDMDVFDPKEARGVCNPEPPGFFFQDMVRIFDFLEHVNLKGLDLVEVAPQYDSYTQILASKLIFKALLKYERGRKK